jgi:hypothetical protein
MLGTSGKVRQGMEEFRATIIFGLRAMLYYGKE